MKKTLIIFYIFYSISGCIQAQRKANWKETIEILKNNLSYLNYDEINTEGTVPKRLTYRIEMTGDSLTYEIASYIADSTLTNHSIHKLSLKDLNTTEHFKYTGLTNRIELYALNNNFKVKIKLPYLIDYKYINSNYLYLFIPKSYNKNKSIFKIIIKSFKRLAELNKG